MIFTVLSKKETSSVPEFVDYWERFFEEADEWPDAQFLEHLKVRGGSLTPDDVEFLFGWKFYKRNLPNTSPKAVIQKLSTLNKLRFDETGELVKEATKLSESGLVKRYFIAHIFSPFAYPIWDQFVLRAYLFLTSRKNELSQEAIEKLRNDDREYDKYRTDFNHWSKSVSSKVLNRIEFPAFRRLDRALWAMGNYTNLLAD